MMVVMVLGQSRSQWHRHGFHQRIRAFAEKRHAEVAAALDRTDARIAALGQSYPAYD